MHICIPLLLAASCRREPFITLTAHTCMLTQGNTCYLDSGLELLSAAMQRCGASELPGNTPLTRALMNLFHRPGDSTHHRLADALEAAFGERIRSANSAQARAAHAAYARRILCG